MTFKKNIHFRGSDAVIELVNASEMMKTQITNNEGIVLLSSTTSFPHILIEHNAQSDFWDLVREEILSVGTRKENNFMKCILLQKTQEELKH